MPVLMLKIAPGLIANGRGCAVIFCRLTVLPRSLRRNAHDRSAILYCGRKAMTLLPCPFCGERNVSICVTMYEPEEREAFAVTCRTRECFPFLDRKSTRLNSSHANISRAV